MKPAVVLALVHNAHLLADQLLRQRDVELITVFRDTAALLKAKGIPCRLHEPSQADISESEQLIEAAIAALDSDPLRELFPEISQAKWCFLKEAYRGKLLETIDWQCACIDLFENLSQQFDLRLTVVSQDIVQTLRTCVRASQAIGVPALHIVDGAYSGPAFGLDAFPSDMVAAVSHRNRDQLIALGLAPQRVRVTGNFEWDRYVGPAPIEVREAACKALNIDPDRPVVTYAGSAFYGAPGPAGQFHELAWSVLRALETLAQRHPRWQFLFRPHPNDETFKNTFSAKCRELGLADIRFDTQPVYASIAVTDVQVSHHSNIGLETILQGKPVVNVDIESLTHGFFTGGFGPLFLPDDGVLHAHTEEMLVEAVEKAMGDVTTQTALRRARETTIYRHAHANDGKNGERLIRLILEMLDEPEHFLVHGQD